MRKDARELKAPDTNSDEYSHLIIGLKETDEIIVGDSVVKVIGYRKGWCRLRISAKKDVPVKRVHLHKTISSQSSEE